MFQFKPEIAPFEFLEDLVELEREIARHFSKISNRDKHLAFPSVAD